MSHNFEERYTALIMNNNNALCVVLFPEIIEYLPTDRFYLFLAYHRTIRMKWRHKTSSFVLTEIAVDKGGSSQNK